MSSPSDRPEARQTNLRTLLDLSPVAMFVTELETGRVVAMNACAEEVFDTSEAEALGRTTLELRLWRSPDGRARFLDRIRSNDGSAMLEIEVEQSGGTVWRGRLGSRILADGLEPSLLVSSLQDANERHRAEEARLASEKRVERIVQSLSEGVVAVDEGGRILQANRRAHEILGIPDGSLAGRDLFTRPGDFLNADGSAMTSQDHPGRLTLQDGKPRFNIDVGITKQDGDRLWINASCSILEWKDDGHPRIMLVSFFDVTARKLAEDRYRGLFENMASGFALYDAILDASGSPVDGRIVEVNPAFETITGLESAQAVGQRYSDLYPNARPEWIRLMADVALTRRPLQMVVRRDKAYDLRVFSPRPGQFATLFNDVTEQFAAQDEVRKSEARLREVADMSQDMLSRHDLQGVCLWASPSCRAFLGIAPEELVGRNAFDFVVPEDHPILRSGLETLVNQDKYRLQYRILRADGSILWVETIWALTRDESGAPLEIHCSTRDIGEQRSQRELLEDTQSLARLGGWEIDLGTGGYQWTQELRRIYGVPPGAPVPPEEEFAARLDPQSRQIVAEANARLVADGTPWSHVLKTHGQDGSPLYLRSTSKAERNPDGSIRRLYGTAQDITEQERMRERLDSASRLNQSILSTTDAIVVLLDPDGRIVRFNEAGQRRSGWSEAEVAGSSFVERLVPEDGRESVQEAFATILRRRIPGHHESPWLARDGKVLWISWADSVILDDSGSPSYLLCTGIDVTGKRRTESVMDALVRRTSALFGQAFFDALVRDLAVLLDVRHAFVARLEDGGSRLRTLSSFLDGGLSEPWEAPIAGTACERAIAEGRVSHAAGERGDFPGSESLLGLATECFMAIPLFSAGNVPIGILGVADSKPMEGEDLAKSILTIFAGRAQGELERLDAEKALRHLNEDLERRVQERTVELVATNRELESFSYSVSHDLRSPLRSINGFAQALEEDCVELLDETGRQYLARIRKASRRMSDLIDDLLSLSQSSRRDLRRCDVDLSAMASEILETLAAAEPDRAVEHDVQPGLHAHADPVLMRAVMENLLGNAWKYTRRKQDAAIRFRAEAPAGDFLRFAVVDNGAGFDMAYAQKLFGTFQRLHGPEEFEGNGIGLATVQRILTRHGGSIDGFGVVGKGATFVFSLPDVPG